MGLRYVTNNGATWRLLAVPSLIAGTEMTDLLLYIELALFGKWNFAAGGPAVIPGGIAASSQPLNKYQDTFWVRLKFGLECAALPTTSWPPPGGEKCPGLSDTRSNIRDVQNSISRSKSLDNDSLLSDRRRQQSSCKPKDEPGSFCPCQRTASLSR